MNWRNLPFRLESELVRTWYRWTALRPGSAPYLSGDGFRSLTPWRFEAGTQNLFVPEQVPAGSLVFCEAWLLEAFLKTVAPRFPGAVSVLSTNGDPNFTQEKLGLLPPTVSRLWVQNCDVHDPRVKALPIGLENARLHTNGIVSDFRSLRRQAEPTVNRVLWGFSESTNPRVRTPVRQILERLPIADRQPTVNSRAYRRALSRYRFVASPPGNGLDCHRTWEALYLRVVPIVLRSAGMDDFVRRGLPLWVVDDYAALDGLTENDLEQKYLVMKPGFESPLLWVDAWKEALLGR